MSRNQLSFCGVGEIARYNWLQYGVALGAAVLLFAAAAARQAMGWPLMVTAGLTVVAALVLWQIAVSLLVSWWIYDLSDLREWTWLHRMAAPDGLPWAYVHTGLDECGYVFRRQLSAPGVILDTFDEQTMTEASVRRARRITANERRPDARCKWDAWPLPERSLGTCYFIFAAHELRRHEDRLALFREAARCMASGGRLVLVEHDRDLWNFMAFGTGFLHFWPAGMWDETAKAAGFDCTDTQRKTGFVIAKIYSKMEAGLC